MVAECVGGAFLSALLQVLFQKLSSEDFVDYFRCRKMDDSLLQNLRVTVNSVNKVVEDVEERQYRDCYVKKWLDELNDEAYKAQDLLDDITTEALRQKQRAESQTVIIGTVRCCFTGLVNRKQFDVDKEILSRIQRVRHNLDHLLNQYVILREQSAGVESVVPMVLMDGSDKCGRDDDKGKIVEHLLSQSMGVNQLPIDVIAITGLAGIGKTTLAKLVYEEEKLKKHFDHRAWVCVSEEFNVHHVTKAILQSLDYPIEQLQSHDLHSYQLKLEKTLMGKKFFLVLDNVWNENREIWEVFQTLLKHVAPQGKILVTTRNQKVAKVMCSTFTHSLKPLEDADGWNLFAKHAFNNQPQDAVPDLVEIGKKIFKRCGGLPLAIKTLGSLLHNDLSLEYWDKILKSDLWELSENDSNIIPSLRLSYHYLPSHLKRCFAYCSIFPKDYNIDKNVLIQLWMADGLIYPTKKSMSLEEAGNEMFNDLESRSFFEPSRSGDDYFIMHDLVNDLAKSLTLEILVQLEVEQAPDMLTKTRYFSYINRNNGNLKIPEEVFKCHLLRTFLLLGRGISFGRGNIMSRLSRLKYLRELSLCGYKDDSKNWIDCISKLKHLHYLDLSWTEVEKLPNSMCSLILLQTLKLRGCSDLTKLPSKFYKLINLRHLDLEGCGIQEMPKYMGKLNQLRTMNKFVVAKKGGSNIKELGALDHLTGSLAISNMEGIKDAADMREANLKAKQLQTLKLQYGQYNYSLEEGQHQEQVLEALEPNHNVKDLTVEGYGGTKFPQWLAGGMRSNLQRFSIERCPKVIASCRDWGLHELLSLKQLDIGGIEDMECFPEEGLLPSNLQSLSFSNCTNLKSINHRGLVHLHFLTSLSFGGCRSMSFEDMSKDGLPPSLSHLSIDDCPLLKERCEKERGPDWPIIAHIPHLRII